MMENIRLAVLDRNDSVCCFMDNSVPKAMRFFKDEFHTYLRGSAYTLTLSTFTDNEDTKHLIEGNHISFTYRNKGYYCNIVKVEKDEKKITITAFGLSFELLNEEVKEFKAPRAMSFVEYVNAYGFEKTLTIGINEVSDKKITHEWTGTETILARLFSTANVFDAELEFVTELNDDYSLKDIKLNIYRKHSEVYQGIGQDKRGAVIRYGQGIRGIRKTSDITELCTAIRPVGRDGLSLASLGYKEEKDENGNVLYYHPSASTTIYAPQSRDRFPSFVNGQQNDRWIVKQWSYDTDNVNTLYGQSLARLKEICVPSVKYEIDGYVEGNVGDTFTIEDTEYDPVLYLEARVTEQKICFTDSRKNKTVFDNFKEIDSQIDSSLLDQMKQLIDENKVYQLIISSNNGIFLPQDVLNTILTAYVKDNGEDISSRFEIQWYADDTLVYTGGSISVDRFDLNPSIVYTVKAVDINKVVKAESEITITKVIDGESVYIQSTSITYQLSDSGVLVPTGEWSETIPELPDGMYLWVRTIVMYSDGQSTESYSVSHNGIDGEAGADSILLTIDSSNGNMFKNSDISTTLTVSIIVGGKIIGSSSEMKATFGEHATLKWKTKALGESEFTEIPSSDKRLSDGGFIFTLTTVDVETKLVLSCDLDY